MRPWSPETARVAAGRDEHGSCTGPTATSAEVTIRNEGLYDAYLDRLALYEKPRDAMDVASQGKVERGRPGRDPELLPGRSRAACRPVY